MNENICQNCGWANDIRTPSHGKVYCSNLGRFVDKDGLEDCFIGERVEPSNAWDVYQHIKHTR